MQKFCKNLNELDLYPISCLNFISLIEALKVVIEAAKPRASVLSLCEKGDAFIMAETGKVFKKEKDMKKGEMMGVVLKSGGSHIHYLDVAKCLCFLKR